MPFGRKEEYEAEPEAGNTPEWHEVQQRVPEGDVSVPVRVEGVVRADQLGTSWGMIDRILLPFTGNAVRILHSEPRRAQMTLWTVGEDVIIAATAGAAQARQGARLQASPAIPVRLRSTGELWVAPIPGADAEAAVNVVEELWSH